MCTFIDFSSEVKFVVYFKFFLMIFLINKVVVRSLDLGIVID